MATASLLGIPSSQSIADQLNDIDEHNTKVRRQRHTFVWLASQLDPQTLDTMATPLFPAYRERRIDGLLDYVLEEIYAGLCKHQVVNVRLAFGRRTRQWLKALWRQTPEAELAWRGLIPSQADHSSYDVEAGPPQSWTWGTYALQFVESLVRDLLRRTQRLARTTVISAPPIPAPVEGADEFDDWDELDTLDRNRRDHRGPTAALTQGDELAMLWTRVHVIRDRLPQWRAEGTKRIQDSSEEIIRLLARTDERAPEDSPPAVDFCTWLTNCLTPARGVLDERAVCAAELVRVLRDLRPFMETICAGSAHQMKPEEKIARAELQGLYELLFADNPSPNALLARVLQLEVAHYSMAGRSELIDAVVEVVQVSGRCSSPWGGPDTPAKKLTGMQLAHFGAFYRKSWRANDWMMGRLDGADRIVRIALNPDRLHRLYAGKSIVTSEGELRASQYVRRYIRALAVESAAPAHRTLLEREWRGDAVGRELVFLDSTAARAPETLPICSAALTRRIHLEVICKELPEVARSAEDDVAAGAIAGKFGGALIGRARAEFTLVQRLARRFPRARAWVQKYTRWRIQMPRPLVSAEDAVDAFKNLPVGSELISQEVGSDLMTRTVTQTVTLAHSALIGNRSGMARAGRTLKILSLPVQMFNLLANRLVSDSRTSAAITTTLLVGGFLFVAGSVWIDKPPPTLAVVGWSMLIGWFATALVRQMNHVALVALIALTVLITLIVLVSASPNGAAVVPVLLVAAAVIALARVLPSSILALAAALSALWWTTGHPSCDDIRAAVCEHPLTCESEGDASKGRHFVDAMGPMVVVLLLSLVAYLAGRRRR